MSDDSLNDLSVLNMRSPAGIEWNFSIKSTCSPDVHLGQLNEAAIKIANN
jgi:hypothetical protein